MNRPTNRRNPAIENEAGTASCPHFVASTEFQGNAPSPPSAAHVLEAIVRSLRHRVVDASRCAPSPVGESKPRRDHPRDAASSSLSLEGEGQGEGGAWHLSRTSQTGHDSP